MVLFGLSNTSFTVSTKVESRLFRSELPHLLCSFKLLICDEHLKSSTRVSVLKFHLVFLQRHIGTFYSGWLVYLSISMLYVLQLCTLRIFYFQSRTSFSWMYIQRVAYSAVTSHHRHTTLNLRFYTGSIRWWCQNVAWSEKVSQSNYTL